MTIERLRAARDELGAGAPDRLGAVSVGTPHASLAELERLADLLGGRTARGPALREHRPRRAGRGRGSRASRRCSSRGACGSSPTPAPTSRPLMDEVDGPVMTDSGEVGLVRAGEHRRRGGVRRARGVRALGRRGARRAATGTLWARWLRPGCSSRGSAEGRGARPRRAALASGAASTRPPGDVIDVRHPQRGANVAGRVLVMPLGPRLELVLERARRGDPRRHRRRPRSSCGEADPILALGAIVARELYGIVTPVVVAHEEVWTGDSVRVRATPRVVRIETGS